MHSGSINLQHIMKYNKGLCIVAHNYLQNKKIWFYQYDNYPPLKYAKTIPNNQNQHTKTPIVDANVSHLLEVESLGKI